MFSAILFLSLVSLILYVTLNDYYLNGTFSKRTEELYQAKIMKELFLQAYFQQEPAERPPSGEAKFNTGRIKYYYRGDILIISVFTAERVYGFEVAAVERSQLDSFQQEGEEPTESSKNL